MSVKGDTELPLKHRCPAHIASLRTPMVRCCGAPVSLSPWCYNSRMDPIFVFGHQSPDTDSVCSAIAYAHLKNSCGDGSQRFVPARLGELNRETRFVLAKVGLDEPELLTHVHVRVQDVMTRDPIVGHSSDTIFEIGERIRQRQVHALPIVDDKGRALGVVTETHLARSYLRELQMQNLHEAATSLKNVAETLDAEVLVGDPEAEVRGDVLIGAMSPESMLEYISPGDLVIVGNRENAQRAALSRNICCLIITGGFSPSPRIQQMARKRNSAILVTSHDTFAAARLINLSVSALTLMARDVLTARPETLIQEIVQDLLESRMGILLVLDNAGVLLGVVTKSDLVSMRARPVILVDHSEESQSVEGIREAEILEIIDHHRLGGLETAGPILALIAPVGSTCTLVLRRYREMRVEPPREIAGLMLAAILSDTMLLKSPTTTAEDREAVTYLSSLWGEDAMDFGVRMYNAKFDMASQSAHEIITADVKVFDFAAGDVAMAQVEVGDKSVVLQRKAELLQAMQEYYEANDLLLVVLLITDIQREGSELLAVGRTRAVERAFNEKLEDGSMYLPGVLSRKKQVVPPIAAQL